MSKSRSERTRQTRSLRRGLWRHGSYLSLDMAGFIHAKEFDGEGNPNLELAVFHVDVTFSNSDGESWTCRDRGPDRSYVDRNGNVILTITAPFVDRRVIASERVICAKSRVQSHQLRMISPRVADFQYEGLVVGATGI